MRILLFLLVLSNSAFSQEQAELNFTFLFQGDSLKENKWYLTQKGDSVKFETIRFFVSTPPKNKVHANSAHLVDWSLPETHQWTVPLNEKGELVMTYGLEPLYHTASVMEGDLDPSLGMYWAWQSGYIQLKIEGESPSANTRNNKFQYHLGGYLDPFSVAKTINFGQIYESNVQIEIDLWDAFRLVKVKKDNEIMIPGKKAVQMMKKMMNGFILIGAY